MDSIMRIVEKAIAHVEADDLEIASELLINDLDAVKDPSDKCETEIVDQLAFCGLKISNRPNSSAKTVLYENEYDKIGEKINGAENSLNTCAKKIFGHLHNLDGLAFEGAMVRKQPMRRFPPIDSAAVIFAAEKRLLSGESLSEGEWLSLLERAETQLDYYEGWFPAPKSGLALSLASRDWGYVKEGSYPEYARLVNQRAEIETRIKDAKKSVEKLGELLDKHEEIQSSLFHAQIAQRQIIEEIRKIIHDARQRASNPVT